MKKLSILTTTLFPVLLICYGGLSQVTEVWATRYNGPDNKNDQARLITTDASGNVIVAGTSGSKKGSFAFITTVKYSPVNGTQQYVARYSGPSNTGGNEYPYGLTVDNTGNIYVTGRSLGNGTGLDFVTIKYNSSLVEQWVARYNSPANLNDEPGEVQVDADGNVFVTGYSDLIGNGIGEVIVTIKYNSSGGQQWIAKYDVLPNNGSNGTGEKGVSLALDGYGNVYVTGESAGMVTIKYNDLGMSVSQEWARNGGSNDSRKVLIDGEHNVIVTGWGAKTVKYSSDGNVIWENLYTGGPSIMNPSFWDMELDASGAVYVTGISSNGSNNDYITVKYNSSGVQQWESRFNDADNERDHARAIALDGNGNAYVTGMTGAKSGRNTTVYYGTVKYNSMTGNQEWVALYKGPDNGGSDGFDVAVDAFGNVYVTGQSAIKTNLDYATIKYSQGMGSKSIITAPSPEITDKFQIKNYPNPFIQNTTIEYQLPSEGKIRLTVYDLLGHEVAILVNETKQAGIHFVNFSGNKLSPGIYFYKMQFGKMVETKKLIVIK